MSRQTQRLIIPAILLLLIATAIASLYPVQAKQPSEGQALFLKRATFDPLVDIPTVPPALRAAPTEDEPATWLVQFDGPVRSEWKQAVIRAGARLYDYIPTHAFLAQMDPATAERVWQVEHVRWVGLYHPAYRLSPDLSAQSAATTEETTAPRLLTVQTLPDTDLDQLASQIESLGGTVQAQAANAMAGYLHINIPDHRIAEVARLQGTIWIEPYFKPTWQNSVGVSDIIRASELREQVLLTGKGQTIGILDSGLDTGNNATLHPDLRGRITKASCFPEKTPCDWSGYLGHGTHVTGVAIGNGTRSGSVPASNDYSDDTPQDGPFTGVAPEASLVFQTLVNFELPDWGEPMRQAYQDGVRIHSNSTGNATGGTEADPEYGGYIAQTQQVDQVAWEHKDMLIVFAAGNLAADKDQNGVVDRDSILSPGTAKNVLTAGASESERNLVTASWGEAYGSPIASDPQANDRDGMAAFSGRGPTDDGRIKPDIAAPGTYIVSLRTRANVFSDTLEGDLSGYTIETSNVYGDSSSWQATSDVYSDSRSWHHIITGTSAITMSPILYTPPIDAVDPNLWNQLDLVFWHKYQLTGDNQLALVLRGPDTSNPDTTITSGPIPLNDLAETETFEGTQNTMRLTSLMFTAPASMDLSQFQIGFTIYSESGTFNSTWTIDDLKVQGPKDHPGLNSKGLLSSIDMTSPGSLLDRNYMLWSGTSMATPMTAGSALLVREWLTRQNIENPGSALIRALLLNGAATMRPGQYASDGATQEIPATHPNMVNGWGRIDLVESLTPPAPRAVWLTEHTEGITTGQQLRYRLNLHQQSVQPSASTSDTLHITLAWTDYPSSLTAQKTLVNDLDLSLTTPNNEHYQGNQETYPAGHTCLREDGFDTCNTVESIALSQAISGTYLVEVRGYQVAQGEGQPFALVATGNRISGELMPAERTLYLPLVER